MTRLLCTGDLHLGAHPEYGRAPGDRLDAQQQVLGRILGIAVERDVDLILNAGDTFDGPGIPPEQLGVYASFVHAANSVELPIVALTGNGKHDAAMRTVNGMEIFNRIPGITVCSTPRIVDVAGTAIACLPWVHPGRLVAARGGGDRDDLNREAAELLVATARGLRASIPDGTPAVLAYHGSISGASLPAGIPTDELREPVLDVLDLAALGFDVIVASHIHVAQWVWVEGFVWQEPHPDGQSTLAPAVLYTGSPMPLNFGEANVAHGVWILDVGDGDTGAEFVPIDSPRFETIAVELDPDGNPPDSMLELLTRTGVVDDAIVRVRYTATQAQHRRLDVAALRRTLLDAGAAVVKVSAEIVREDRARVDGVTEELAPLAAFDLWVDANDYPGDTTQLRDRAGRILEQVGA